MKDAAAVKVLTIIGLIYLPTTIVAVSATQQHVSRLEHKAYLKLSRTSSRHSLYRQMSMVLCMFLATRGCLLLLPFP